MIYVITGQTGTGKSQFAVDLALKIGGEIINGDAFQVYEEMRIGNAYPKQELLDKVPHHLYGFVPLTHNYSVKQYQADCRKVIADLQKRGKPIIIVGGTGLYIKAVLFDYVFVDHQPVDMTRFDNMTNEELHSVLASYDKNAAAIIHPNNRRRTLRAIEIYLATGESKTNQEAKQTHKLIYPTRFLGLKVETEDIYAHINQRVLKMVDDGLFEEALALKDKYEVTSNAFQAIGYKQIYEGIATNQSKDEIITAIQVASRRYAKRQLTFIASHLPVEFFNSWAEALASVKE